MCGTFVEKEAAGFVHRVVLVGGFLSWIDRIRCGSIKEPCKLASRTDLGVSQYRQKSLLKMRQSYFRSMEWGKEDWDVCIFYFVTISSPGMSGVFLLCFLGAT